MSGAFATGWAGTKVAVAGAGLSGQAARVALAGRGAGVVLVDDAATGPGIVRSADLDPRGYDLVVASPGWAPSHRLLIEAAAAGVPVVSEVELAWRLRARPDAAWLAITGTNGKTTTTQMLASILQAGGERALAAGNVGLPLVQAVCDPSIEVFACELSSFQLHLTDSMAAQAAAVLNLAPDHLDWHGSLQAYAEAKGRVFERVERACVYNVADPATRRLVEAADVADGAIGVGFSLAPPRLGEVGLAAGMLVDRAFCDDRRVAGQPLANLTDLAHLAGPGGRLAPHIVADALAAAALALAHGCPPQAVAAGLRDYRPGAHRLEVVATADGVAWVDDSKATNAHAASAALSSFPPGGVVWIAGGLAKGARFDDLVAQAADRLRAVVVIGLDREPFLSALAAHAGQVPVIEIDPVPDGAASDAGPPGVGRSGGAAVMRRAVAAAQALARPGDTVLLAPAGASMDQFANYAERGDQFAAAVREAIGAAQAETNQGRDVESK